MQYNEYNYVLTSDFNILLAPTLMRMVVSVQTSSKI